MARFTEPTEGPAAIEADGWTGDRQPVVVRVELEELCHECRGSRRVGKRPCRTCQGRGVKLTAEGRGLLGFQERWK